MKTNVTYLFDPLCGWCYGASPAIQKLSEHPAIALTPIPTGLFADGHRKIDAAFASYAWANDVRIEKLTGQKFNEDYRINVLGKLGSSFDSSAMTLALSAVQLTQADRLLQALIAFQKARYVQGIDTSDTEHVEKILRELGLMSAADRLASRDNELLEMNTHQLAKAQNLMHALGIQGVPAIVMTDLDGSKLIDGRLLFGNFEELMAQLSHS
jgi:putative protein-disulfide isomerase